jgi:hypothetical protein
LPLTPQVVHTEKSLSSVALVGGVPALHDAVEALRQFVLAIALEPFRLDQAANMNGDPEQEYFVDGTANPPPGCTDRFRPT